MILNETRAEARLRNLNALIPGLRRQLLPRLSDQQQRDAEDFFAGLQTEVTRATREHVDVMSDTHLTDEGRRYRIAKINGRETKLLDRLDGDTKRIVDKRDEMRRDALHGHVAHEGGFVQRKPTKDDDLNRARASLASLDAARRRDTYFNAHRHGWWDVIDAVESARDFEPWAVDPASIEAGRAMRLERSPSAPAIKALESVIQMRNYITESLRAEMTDVR